MARILEWQNLVFVLALLLAGVLVLGAALGLVGTDAEAELDVDADADADVDGDHDLPAAALALLGVGRAPLSLLLITLLVAFGATGICLNLLLEPWLGSPLARGVLAVLGAGSASMLAGGAMSRLFARFVPGLESYATEAHDVIGVTGVAEMRITGRFGVARVSDRTGTPLQLRCRAHATEIPKGSEIVVVDFDDERRIYTVDSTAEKDGENT
ncbi:MAG: DUF1449 family protein [Polyangiaceae bacterium]|nr:DUF1449 family protein [Polyangiaceae bacterium]